jgi:hypothetical protein
MASGLSEWAELIQDRTMQEQVAADEELSQSSLHGVPAAQPFHAADAAAGTPLL